MEIASLFSRDPKPFRELLKHEDAAIMAIPYIFESLASAGMYREAATMLSPALVLAVGGRLIPSFLDHVKSLIIEHRADEARMLLEQIAFLAQPGGHGSGILRNEYKRRHAQCLRGDGQFTQAMVEFQAMLLDADRNLRSLVMSEIALTEAGVRWMDDAAIPSDQASARDLRDRLARARPSLNKALSGDGGRHIAHYLLGVISLLDEDHQEAYIHFTQAVDAVYFKRDVLERYGKGGLLPRLLLYYAFSILLSCKETQFSHAAELMRRADQGYPRQLWPEWLRRRAIELGVAFGPNGGVDLVDLIGSDFPETSDELSWKDD